MTSLEAADRFRIQNSTPAGEVPLATLARGLVGSDNRALGLGQKSVTAAAYVLTAEDSGKRLLLGAAVTTISIPVGLPDGFACALLNMNDTSPTITAAAGLTLTLIPDGTVAGGGYDLAQYGKAYIEQISATALVISGNSALT